MADTSHVLCVHCESAPAITADHIPGRRFFISPMPSDLITVPSCDDCNRALRLVEEYIATLTLMGPAGSTNPGRLLWPKEERNLKREQMARFRKMLAAHSVNIVFRTPAGIYTGKGKAIQIERKRFHTFIRKLVRGLFFFETNGNRLPSDVVIEAAYIDSHEDAEPFRHPLKMGSRKWDNIFEYFYALTTDDPHGSMWRFHFYGSYWFGALVVPKEAL